MAIITTNTLLSAVSYAAGEILDIRAGATLTIDVTPSVLPGNISCVTSGRCLVEPADPTIPLIITLNGFANDYIFEKNGVFECKGSPIVLGQGTGATASFTLNGTLAFIPWPSYVEVETSSGSGIYLPWPVVSITGFAGDFATTDFGNGQDGMVCFWNFSTRVLSCGDGTNGVPWPNGANVRIPNIYLHSNAGNATPATRTMLDFSPTGTMLFDWVGASQNLWFSMTGHGRVRARAVGVVGGWLCSNTNADVELDGFCVNPDPTQTTVATTFSLTSLLGTTTLKRITTLQAGLVTTTAQNTMNTITSVAAMENVKLMRRNGRTATTGLGATLVSLYPQAGRLRVPNLTVIGGAASMTSINNADFENYRHASRIGAQEASLADNCLTLINCQGQRYFGVYNAGLSAPRAHVVTADAQTNDIKFYGVDFNGNSAMAGFIAAGNGGNIEFYNSVITAPRATVIILDAPATSLQAANKLLNCRVVSPAGVMTIEASKSAVYNMAPAQFAAAASRVSLVHAGALNYVFGNFCDPGVAPTDGQMVFGPFSNDPALTFTGLAQTDQAGSIELFNTGDAFEVETPFAAVGVTGFASSPGVYYTYVSTLTNTVPPAGVDFEFRLRNPGGTYGAYAALTAANLATAMAALSGHSSNVGLLMQIRGTATTTVGTRTIRQIAIRTTVDGTYSFPESTVSVTGLRINDVAELRHTPSDALIASRIGDGVIQFPAGVYIGEPLYVRRRTSGGDTIASSEFTPFTAVLGDNGSVPLFSGEEVQLANSAAVDQILDIVSSLGGGGGGGGPTASQIATAVRTEIATELARIDVAISTREAESAAASRASTNQAEHDATQVDIAGISAGSAPSAAVVASAVRTELATELARVDTAVSTRLATSGYTAPSTTAATASAVRTELATELGRIDVAVSTREAESAAATRATADQTGHTATQTAVGAIGAAPSAAAVASAVRTELTTELDRVDVAISTREAESAASARATADQDAHDATQAALGDLPDATAGMVIPHVWAAS